MTALDDDERAAVERIAYEEESVTTDLRPETLVAKVERLRPELVAVAGDRETVDYSTLTDGFSTVHGSRIGTVLAVVGLLEDAFDRPLLPAVAMGADAEFPGEWYFEMADRADQVDERIPDDEPGRQALWSTQVFEVWQYWAMR